MSYDGHFETSSPHATVPQAPECDLKIELLPGETSKDKKEKVLPPPPKWAKITAYAETVLTNPAYLAYMATENNLSAEALSKAIVNAAIDLLPEDGQIVVNSSTGKDSTLAGAIVVQTMLERKAHGLPTPPIVIAIADTGSEFPTMALRMKTEAAAINRWAKTAPIPIRAIISEPPVKDRLLVEIIGNGKPLPKQSVGHAHHGKGDAQGWCMSRAKAGPLGKITQLARGKPTLSILGVRKKESVRRTTTIDKYSEDLPLGLTRLEAGLGCQPIVHWESEWIKDWGSRHTVPWNKDSFRELLQIYGKASNDFESPGECAIVVTEEGKVSSSCSDLSGARFGCWMCMLSQNKSLKNMALHDDRFRWMKGFHSYLYNHHRRNARRREKIAALGFNESTLFPKNYTMRERYFLAMLAARAELAVGETLIQPEEWTMIETLWKKSGIHTLSREDVFWDVDRWIKSGDSKPHWACDGRDLVSLANTLNEGIPAGAYFHLLHPALNTTIPLESEHLREALAFARACDAEKASGTIVCGNEALRTKISDLIESAGITCVATLPHNPKRKGRVLNLKVRKFRGTQALEAVHMTALIGQGCGIWPTLQAHVMTDVKDPDKMLVLVTDAPSTIGLKTQTGLLSGLHGAGWVCHGGREPTRWELEMSDGRNFFYAVSIKKLQAEIVEHQKEGRPPHPLLASFWENTRVIALRGEPEDAMAHAFTQNGHAVEDWEKLDAAAQEEMKDIALDLLHYTTLLEAPGRSAFAIARNNARNPLLTETSKEGDAFRADLRRQLAVHVDPNLKTFIALMETWKRAAKLCRTNGVGPAVLQRTTYDLQIEAVDPEVPTLWSFRPQPQRRAA